MIIKEEQNKKVDTKNSLITEASEIIKTFGINEINNKNIKQIEKYIELMGRDKIQIQNERPRNTKLNAKLHGLMGYKK